MRALDRLGLAKPVLARVAQQIWRLARRWEKSTFKNFQPGPRDVFVAVYPKAGNNWMMQIGIQIAYRGRAEFEHIHELVAWPHSPVPELVVPLDSPVHEQSPTGLRVIKTQLKYPATPYDPRAHYLAVIRDPRDTLVSAYHFLNGIVGGIVDVQFSLDALFDFTLAGKFPICWAEHAASWWSLRDRDNVMVTTFAEMKEDLTGVVRRASQVMGVVLSESELATVVEKSGFRYMKAHETQFAPPIPTFRGKPATMIRAGEVGDGKRTLTSEQRRAIDQHYRHKLAALGSDLPYDELFNREPG